MKVYVSISVLGYKFKALPRTVNKSCIVDAQTIRPWNTQTLIQIAGLRSVSHINTCTGIETVTRSGAVNWAGIAPNMLS